MKTKLTDKEIEEKLIEYGFSIEEEFVPFSKSRNAKNAKLVTDFSANWKVKLYYKKILLFETDYSVGIGYLPSYKQGKKSTLDYYNLMKEQCEKGFELKYFHALGSFSGNPKNKFKVDFVNFIYCIISDYYSYLNSSDLKDFLKNFGYTEKLDDTLKGIDIYKELEKQYICFSKIVPTKDMEKLEELFTDY
jgi:hypothetical protein